MTIKKEDLKKLKRLFEGEKQRAFQAAWDKKLPDYQIHYYEGKVTAYEQAEQEIENLLSRIND